MNRRWTIIIAIVAGLACGLSAAVLFLPERADVASDTVTVTAIVPDHGQGMARQAGESAALAVQATAMADSDEEIGSLPAAVVSKLLDIAFAAKEAWTVKPGTRILLVPHHLIAARQIASLLSATPKPTIAYLVTPDHFGACMTVACAADVSGSGFLKETQGVTLIAPSGFDHEHAVTGLVPFMQRAWGQDVRIVPIMVRPDATEAQTAALTSALASALQKDSQALLVDTIDASHYQPAELADFHDVLTQDVISGLADKEVGRAEIDAPAVLRVALKTARDLGLGDVTIHAHTNSLRLMQAEISQDSTSHFLVSFAPGPIAKQQATTLLFMGDMMFDRNVAARIQQSGDPAYAFAKIEGQEGRFFRGQDLVITNLEGPVGTDRLPPDKGDVDFLFDPKILPVIKQAGVDVLSQANNHALDQGRRVAEGSKQSIAAAGLAVFGDQVRDDAADAMTIVERRGKKIALLGFNITDNALDKAAASAALAAAKRQADQVVVFMHWGNEYQARPSRQQTDTAHWLIDQGADTIIGSHPHWMQSVEVYRGHIIAYSLGNFIFDQDWSKETDLGLVVGLVFEPNSSTLRLYPIQIVKSQPSLLTGDDRQARLDYLASISDPALSTQIKDGLIMIND